MNVIHLNAQELLYLHPDEVIQTSKLNDLKGLKIHSAVRKELSWFATIMGKFSNIRLALGKVDMNNYWFTYHLLSIEGHLYRMRIVMHVCKECNWNGLIGDAYEADCYLGVNPEEKKQANVQLTHLKKIHCPYCAIEIPQAIWIDEEEKTDAEQLFG